MVLKNEPASPLPRLILQKGREDAIRRMHPWVFSGAIAREEGETADGDLVEVISNRGEFLARVLRYVS